MTDSAHNSVDARPLAGVRVIELAKLIPSALLARKLADLGADVVKVEPPPSGDYLRAIPPLLDGQSIYHRLLDRNKRSVLLDIDDPTDLQDLRALIGAADVVIDGSRPGALEAKGIGWAQMVTEHPALVVCSISGFGADGPLSSLPAHGLSMEALTGCLPITFDAVGHPSVSEGWHASWAIELGAVNAALATTAAVLASRTSGRGAVIDASCWDAGVESLRYHLALYEYTGQEMEQLKDYGPLYRPYRTEDGRAVFFAALEKKFWVRFCQAVKRPDLVGVRREGAVDFSRDASLEAELTSLFSTRSAEEWQDLLMEAGVPVGVVMDVPSLLSSEELAARGMFEPVEGEPGNVPDAVRWLWPVDARMGSHPTRAPKPGEHQAAVFESWTGSA